MPLEPSSAFLQAIEEFNRQAFFECHETLEDIWRPLPPGPEKTFYQGIIQIAVGLHHLQHQNLTGARNLLSVGLDKLKPLESYSPCSTWINLPQLITKAQQLLEQVSQYSETPSAPLPTCPPIRL